MTCLTFFPTGNADTTLLRLADERLVLFDFADMRNPDDRFDARCDLKLEMRREMERAGQDDFAVVCFTHLDDDHVCGASEFFWFRYAAKYQGPGRVKFREMWVPAGAITEVGVEGDAQVIRAEARHRLLEGEGIKVFSRPEALRKFLEDNGLTLESRAHCIVDAGQTVPVSQKPTPDAPSSSCTPPSRGGPTTGASLIGTRTPSWYRPPCGKVCGTFSPCSARTSTTPP